MMKTIRFDLGFSKLRQTMAAPKATLCGCLLMLISLAPVSGHAAASIVNIKVPDLELINQDGEPGRLVSDIIGDKIAAITFTYTSCTTICPILDGIFKSVQTRLGDVLGREVFLITISIDPANDIPPRLKARAEKLGAKPGWNFFTGERETVHRVLKGFEVFTPDIYNHPPAVIIVDGRRDIWSRMSGFPSPKLIEKTLNEHLAMRQES